MADEKLPPITTNDAIDLIALVVAVNTLRDLGVFGWWLFGHCSTHGDRQEPVFEESVPAQSSFGCGRCYRAGYQRSIRVEDIQAI